MSNNKFKVYLTLDEANEIDEKVNKFNAVNVQIMKEELINGMNDDELWRHIVNLRNEQQIKDGDRTSDIYWALNFLQDIIFKMKIE